MPAALGDQQAPEPQEVFISYSRKDKEFVRRLDEELKRRDREAWVDWEGIPPGDTWEKTIYGAIEATHTFIFVLTPDSIASEVCGREIAHAAANNKRLVPIVHRDVADDRVPKSLGELNWIFCRDIDDFKEATDKLVRALDTDLKWVRAHTRLLTRAIEWDANSKSKSFVLRGEDLRSAEQWLAEAGSNRERQPTALQTEYIIASRKAATRRQRNTLAAVTLALVVAIALAVVAFFARQEAVKQEAEAKDQTKIAVAANKRTRETASRDKVSLARYAEQGGESTRALANLVQALRLNPENTKASECAVALLTQLSWWIPVAHPMPHDSIVIFAQFSPDPHSQRVLTVSDDGIVRVWNTASGESIGLTNEDGSAVTSATFTRDGERVVTASLKTTALWDVASGKPIGEPVRHSGRVTFAQLSPDGRCVVTALEDGTVQARDAASGKPIGDRMQHNSAVTSVQFSPDGQRVLTLPEDKTVQVWEAASGKPLGKPIQKDSIRSAQLSPNGQRVLTLSEDGMARVWNTAGGEPVGLPTEHQSAVTSGTFSPDGERVVTTSTKTAQVWDAASGKPLGDPMRHATEVSSAQFSPDGQRLVTVSWMTTALWDAATGKSIGEPKEHGTLVDWVEFSPDGRRILVAASPKLEFTVTSTWLRTWDISSVQDITNGQRGRVLADMVEDSVVKHAPRPYDGIITKADTKDDILLLAELAETTCGVTLESDWRPEYSNMVPPDRVITQRGRIAAQLRGPSSERTPLRRFVNWSVSDLKDRTITPLSPVTVSEWVENKIKEGTIDSLRAGLRVDQPNARVTAHLGRRLADQALKQGSDPDEARRARGEADFLTSRALKLAPDSEEVKMLRDEVVKLLGAELGSRNRRN